MSTVTQQRIQWRYADYLTWPENERWELIDGIAYNMSPAPSVAHQKIAFNIAYLLREHLGAQPCQVFIAPIDVLLPLDEETDENVPTVVQPDVIVVCDAKKVTERCIRGAPDLVIEVISQSTALKDEGFKRDLYERAGVQEYWLVHPIDHVINRYALKESAYNRPDVYGAGNTITSSRFRDLTMDLCVVFEAQPAAMPQPGK